MKMVGEEGDFSQFNRVKVESKLDLLLETRIYSSTFCPPSHSLTHVKLVKKPNELKSAPNHYYYIINYYVSHPPIPPYRGLQAILSHICSA